MIDHRTDPIQPNWRRPVEGRRILDLAEGILIAVRRCQPDAAFDELVNVAHRYELSVFAVSAALVALATRHRASTPSEADAASAADREWSGLLGDGT